MLIPWGFVMSQQLPPYRVTHFAKDVHNINFTAILAPSKLIPLLQNHNSESITNQMATGIDLHWKGKGSLVHHHNTSQPLSTRRL